MAKSSARITNMDILEKEIYRLKLEAKLSEAKMEQQFDYLRQHLGTLTLNSIFNKHKKEPAADIKSRLAASFLNHPRVQALLDELVGFLADKLSTGAADLFGKKSSKERSDE